MAINVLFNDTDDFGPKIVVAVDDTGLRGSVVINPPNQANNLVIYSPNGEFDALKAGQTATETFKYTVSDGIGSSVGTVTVTIQRRQRRPDRQHRPERLHRGPRRRAERQRRRRARPTGPATTACW